MADSRLAFDIVARGGSSAAAEFEKVARATDHAGDAMKKNSKISTDAAKASEALTKARGAESNALDKVQVAESKLSDARQAAQAKVAQVKAAENDLLSVRNDTSSSTSQIAAAETKLQNARNSSNTSNSRVLAGEKALAKARREAALAGNEALKATKKLGQALDNEGKKSGGGWGKSFVAGIKKWVSPSALGDLKKSGQFGATAFGSGFLGVLKTPVLGPAVVAAIAAGVLTVMPAVGAIAAGALVAGFGAGLVLLGSVFAAKSVAVKNAWNRSLWAMSADMKILSKPFERTLIDMAAFARRTFVKLTPALSTAFKDVAPVLSQFGDNLGRAFEKLGPAIRPLSTAFSAVLKSLGPAMQSAMGSFAHGLQLIADSVSRNPDALSDLVTGTGKLFVTISKGITTLNDINGAFKALPGNASLVTRTMNTLSLAIEAALFPFKELEFALNSVQALSHSMDLKPEGFAAASEAANQTVKNLQAVRDAAGGAGAGLDKQAGAAGRSAHETHAANVAAYLLATAFERQAAATQHSIDLLNRRSNLLLGLAGAEIDYQQAVDDATQAIKDNGKTHDITTQKGRDNERALLAVAAAAGVQRDSMLKANDGNIKAGEAALTGRAAYIKLAIQMGHNAAEAKAMAAEFITIPPVTRVAVTANITDLESKLATAKTKLKDKTLTATQKAKLEANIKGIERGIATAKGLLATLPQSRTAKLQANKKDLEEKIAAAQKELANKNLTKERRAKLTADIANARSGISTINGMLGGLPKSRTITITTKYVTVGTPAQKSRAAAQGHTPGHTTGGSVTKGQPVIVGEHRPELFVPNENGTIIPKVPSMAVGSSIASGMAAGLRGGAGDAVSAAADVAMSIIAKAKDVLGISSPSKAFAQLGLWVNQGFSIGLKGSAKQVQSVMASLMSKVLDISYNAADTKKAISKTIASLNAALAKARDRIKPITHGMSKAQVAAAERSNRAVAASIRAIQAKLKSAKTDLANVSSIAARLGTTQKRNAVIGMLQRENVAMQKIANARAVVASQLKVAQDRLADAVQVRDEFRKSITDSALAFNSITNISTDAGRSLVSQDVLAHMRDTLQKTKQFASQLASLKSLGLRGDLYKQIAEAGVESGSATADALLQGGRGAINTANDLQRQIANASAALGNTAAANMYQAGVDAAQGLVNGLLAKTKALDAASKKLAAAIVAQIKKTLGIRSPSKVLQWHGSMAGKGFTKGIEGEYGRVAKAGAGLGNAATNIRSTPGRPGGGGSGQLPLKVELVFKSDGTAHMNYLVSEFRKYVQINGGNVQKVLGQ